MPENTRKSRASLLYSERAEYVKKIIHTLESKMDIVLELGAGRGDLAECICEFNDVVEYIMVEPQPVSAINSKIKVIQSTIENLQLKQKVNIVLAFEVVEHITNPKIFLDVVRKSLSDNGLFIFSTPSSDGYEIKLLQGSSDSITYDHVSLYNPKSISILLEKNGFELLYLETPGKIDVEILKRKFDIGQLFLADNPALKFLLTEGYSFKDEFQKYLVINKLSSHMRCVARKKLTSI